MTSSLVVAGMQSVLTYQPATCVQGDYGSALPGVFRAPPREWLLQRFLLLVIMMLIPPSFTHSYCSIPLA